MDALFNDVASSCAPESREADLEAELERQPDDFESLKNLRLVRSLVFAFPWREEKRERERERERRRMR